MQEWLSLLYVGPQQAVPVIVAVVLWVALAGLGALVTPKNRIVEASPFIGWAVVSTVFTLVGVVVAQPFFVLTVIAGLGAVAGIALAAWRRTPLFVAGSWRILVLALPLLLIAGAMEPSQWDEFSHWLPAPRYLFLFDGFPTAERPDAGPQMLPAYPYAWPFLIYLAARIAGHLLGNVGGILNMLMLLSLATLIVRAAFAAAGRPREQTIGWSLAAGIVIAATLFNPTFVQKIVLTNYSDIACSVVTGIALLVGYRLLQDVRAREPLAATAWQLALVLALLVNIRQPNIVVVASALIALVLAAARDSEGGLGRILSVAAAAALPPVMVYAAWRWYVGVELAQVPGAEATIQPVQAWNVAAIPQILWAMIIVAWKKIAFFAPMLIACGFAVRALARGVRTDFDRIAILTASVFAAYNAFLLFIYVAHFELANALSVVSYWRYNIDIGAVAMIFIVTGAMVLWSRRPSFDRYPCWAAPAAVGLVLILPVALAHKIRFDLEPPKPHFIAVAKDLRAMGIPGETIWLLDPHGTGEAGVITRFILGSRGQRWISAFQATTAEGIADFLKNLRLGDHLLVHSISQAVLSTLGLPLDPRRSYLLRRNGRDWAVIKEWPKPSDHPW